MVSSEGTRSICSDRPGTVRGSSIEAATSPASAGNSHAGGSSISISMNGGCVPPQRRRRNARTTWRAASMSPGMAGSRGQWNGSPCNVMSRYRGLSAARILCSICRNCAGSLASSWPAITPNRSSGLNHVKRNARDSSVAAAAGVCGTSAGGLCRCAGAAGGSAARLLFRPSRLSGTPELPGMLPDISSFRATSPPLPAAIAASAPPCPVRASAPVWYRREAAAPGRGCRG